MKQAQRHAEKNRKPCHLLAGFLVEKELKRQNIELRTQ